MPVTKKLKKKNYEIPVIIIGERFTRPLQSSFLKAIDKKQHSQCKRPMGICHWIGSHFDNWIDYNGVTFSVMLLEWGCTFSDFWGKKVLHIYC